MKSKHFYVGGLFARRQKEGEKKEKARGAE